MIRRQRILDAVIAVFEQIVFAEIAATIVGIAFAVLATSIRLD